MDSSPKGFPDPDTGKVLEYPINGFLAFLISAFVTIAGYSVGWYSPSHLVENYSRLATTSMVVAFALSIYLYARGRNAKDSHATGSFIYDFYIGVERHPRIGQFDLKVCLFRLVVFFVFFFMVWIYSTFLSFVQTSLDGPA